jgi:Rnl2 family RNA ligase
MTYKSYEKIAESTEEYAFDAQNYRLLQKWDWVITEKIHGANFCIIFTPDTIQYAKRKEILTETDDFFDYRKALAGKEKSLQDLADSVRNEQPEAHTVLVYGELFGGGYPHPEVPALPATLVQTGVYYTPRVEFCIFDVAYQTENEAVTYLAYPDMQRHCKASVLLYSFALWVGKWQDAWKYDIHFQSTLPALLGYPALPANLAEGVVLKPLLNQYIDTPKGKVRPVFKRKIEQFAETQYQQATGTQDTFLQLSQAILAMLTMNRLQNARSKVGKGKEHIYALVETDIQAEIAQKHAKIWQKTPQKQRAALMGQAKQAFEKLWDVRW